MGDLQTIKIHDPGGYAVINLSDFDEAKHQPFDAEAELALVAWNEPAEIEHRRLDAAHQAEHTYNGRRGVK